MKTDRWDVAPHEFSGGFCVQRRAGRELPTDCRFVGRSQPVLLVFMDELSVDGLCIAVAVPAISV